MIVKHCKLCTTGNLFASCKGCGIPVCKNCCRMELDGFGCVSAWPVYYCLNCAAKRFSNPDVLLRPPPK